MTTKEKQVEGTTTIEMNIDDDGLESALQEINSTPKVQQPPVPPVVEKTEKAAAKPRQAKAPALKKLAAAPATTTSKKALKATTTAPAHAPPAAVAQKAEASEPQKVIKKRGRKPKNLALGTAPANAAVTPPPTTTTTTTTTTTATAPKRGRPKGVTKAANVAENTQVATPPVAAAGKAQQKRRKLNDGATVKDQVFVTRIAPDGSRKTTMEPVEPYVSDAQDARPRKRPKKDPNAPKRPQNAFFLFMNASRKKLRERHKDMTNTEIRQAVKEIWNKWTTTGDPHAKPFLEAAARDKEIYNKKVAEYRAKLKEQGEQGEQQPAKADEETQPDVPDTEMKEANNESPAAAAEPANEATQPADDQGYQEDDETESEDDEDEE